MHAQRSTTPAHWRNRSACCRAARPQRTQAKGSSPAGATWAAVRAAALPNEGAGGGAAAAATGALSRSHTATQAQQPLAAASCMSGGLPISSYTASEALAAVSNKTFGCTMCGKCCTLDADAEVWANDAEVAAMAAHKRMSAGEFEAAFLQPYAGVPGWRLLQSQTLTASLPPHPQQHLQQHPQQQRHQQQRQQQQQQQHSDPQQQRQQQQQVCVFLDTASNACTVYAVRPLQCAAFPWWPELMGAGGWAAQGRVCEGIEHPDAPALDRWAAARTLQAATEGVIALEAAKPAGWEAGRELYGSSGSCGASGTGVQGGGGGSAGGGSGTDGGGGRRTAHAAQHPWQW